MAAWVGFSQSSKTEPLAHDSLEAEFAGVPENNIRRQVVAMIVELNACTRLGAFGVAGPVDYI
jgi:hypothetical protein